MRVHIHTDVFTAIFVCVYVCLFIYLRVCVYTEVILFLTLLAKLPQFLARSQQLAKLRSCRAFHGCHYSKYDMTRGKSDCTMAPANTVHIASNKSFSSINQSKSNENNSRVCCPNAPEAGFSIQLAK